MSDSNSSSNDSSVSPPPVVVKCALSKDKEPVPTNTVVPADPAVDSLTDLVAAVSLTEVAAVSLTEVAAAPVPVSVSVPVSAPIINKGTGAGGANTNLNGKSFEKKTENESRLLSNGFVRNPIPGKKGINDFYLEKVESPTKRIVYLTQGGLKSYFKHFLNKEMCRSPDEAYLFCEGDSYTLKILEKKNQNTEGSVDTKLLAGRGFIDEYEYLLGENYTVQYAFCISDFLKKSVVADTPKSRALRHINQKYGIVVLFGDDTNYYETLDAWISSESAPLSS